MRIKKIYIYFKKSSPVWSQTPWPGSRLCNLASLRFTPHYSSNAHLSSGLRDPVHLLLLSPRQPLVVFCKHHPSPPRPPPDSTGARFSHAPQLPGTWLIPALQHGHCQSALGSPIQPSPGLPGQQPSTGTEVSSGETPQTQQRQMRRTQGKPLERRHDTQHGCA